MARPTTLYLLRHGEIDRPPVADFDDASLTEAGRAHILALGESWPDPRPSVIYCSPLARSIETASLMAIPLDAPVRTRADLEEWSATEQDVSQETYLEWERRCWADLDHHNEEGESLRHATDRIAGALTAIAAENRGAHVLVSGHSILFALFLAHVRGERPTEASKNRIGFGQYATVEYRGEFRIVRDFPGNPGDPGHM